MTENQTAPKKVNKRIKPKVEEVHTTPLPTEPDEKPRVATHNFIYKGVELVPKRLTFALRKASLKLIADYRSFTKPYVSNATSQLVNSPRPDRVMFQTDEKFNEALHKYVMAVQEFHEDNTIALMLYLSDSEKLREVISTFLDGKIEEIDFNTEDSVEQDQLLSIGTEVINNFFTLTMKSIIGATKL